MPRYSVSVVLALFAGACVCPPHAHAQTWVDDVGPTCTPIELGRLGLVRNLHAYNQGGVAVAPIRGLVELLGGSVEYHAPKVVIRSADHAVTIEIEPGSRTARVNGRTEDMGAKAFSYSNITCAPVRFLGSALGARVEHRAGWTDEDFAFASNPRVILCHGSAVYVLLIHQQPPDAVAKFVADMENTNQWDATFGAEGHFHLGPYGIDWICEVTDLASDGQHFCSGWPDTWDEDSPLAPEPPDDGVPRRYIIGQGYVPPLPPHEPRPGFWANAAAIYGKRAGKWQLLFGTQDALSYEICDRVGIPYNVGRELNGGPLQHAALDDGYDGSEPALDQPREPAIMYHLTPDNGRVLAYVGSGYYVSGLNFTRAYDFIERGVKVLGQVLIPAFEETDRPISIEMTLTAFDRDLRVLGSTSISFHAVPSRGGLLPFEATLYDVAIGDVACVSILPKGAWVIRD